LFPRSLTFSFIESTLYPQMAPFLQVFGLTNSAWGPEILSSVASSKTTRTFYDNIDVDSKKRLSQGEIFNPSFISSMVNKEHCPVMFLLLGFLVLKTIQVHDVCNSLFASDILLFGSNLAMRRPGNLAYTFLIFSVCYCYLRFTLNHVNSDF
jgi:hypothetical protein